MIYQSSDSPRRRGHPQDQDQLQREAQTSPHLATQQRQKRFSKQFYSMPDLDGPEPLQGARNDDSAEEVASPSIHSRKSWLSSSLRSGDGAPLGERYIQLRREVGAHEALQILREEKEIQELADEMDCMSTDEASLTESVLSIRRNERRSMNRSSSFFESWDEMEASSVEAPCRELVSSFKDRLSTYRSSSQSQLVRWFGERFPALEQEIGSEEPAAFQNWTPDASQSTISRQA